MIYNLISYVMGIIIIMLVFGSHCPEICDNFRQPAEYPGVAWLHVYLIPVIFNHYSLTESPCILHLVVSQHQQVIIIMNSKIIGLIRLVHALFREARPNNSLTEWFTKPVRLKIISLLYHSIEAKSAFFSFFLIMIIH